MYSAHVKPSTSLGAFRVQFTRTGYVYARGAGGEPGQVPAPYEATIELTAQEIGVHWKNRPEDSEALKELTAEARRLVTEYFMSQLRIPGDHGDSAIAEEEACRQLQFDSGANDVEAVEFLKANEWGTAEADDPSAPFRRVLVVFEELIHIQPERPSEVVMIEPRRYYAQAAFQKDTQEIAAVVGIGRLQDRE